MSTFDEDENAFGNAYSFRDDAHRTIPRWKPQSLPQALNIDGKHVWEPPIFAYSALIDEEYEQKRKATLAFTKGDVVKTTRILDVDAECDMLLMFQEWCWDNVNESGDAGDPGTASFFAGMYEEISSDYQELLEEWKGLDLFLPRRRQDGTYVVTDKLVDYFSSDDEASSVRSSNGGGEGSAHISSHGDDANDEAGHINSVSSASSLAGDGQLLAELPISSTRSHSTYRTTSTQTQGSDLAVSFPPSTHRNTPDSTPLALRLVRLSSAVTRPQLKSAGCQLTDSDYDDLD